MLFILITIVDYYDCNQYIPGSKKEFAVNEMF